MLEAGCGNVTGAQLFVRLTKSCLLYVLGRCDVPTSKQIWEGEHNLVKAFVRRCGGNFNSRWGL